MTMTTTPFDSGGGLSLNAALASALAPPRVVSGGGSGGGGGSVARGGKSSSPSVRALASHPSLPHVAYLLEESFAAPSSPATPSAGGGAGGPSSRRSSPPPSSASAPRRSSVVKRQRLVVARRRRDGDGVGGRSAILASLPLERLPPAIESHRRTKSRGSRVATQPLTLAALGPLRSIAFLDREALFWSTRRHHGSVSDHPPGSVSLEPWLDGDEGEGNVVRCADAADALVGRGAMGRGICLGLQFRRVLVVVRFEVDECGGGDGFGAPSEEISVLCCLEGQRGSGKDSAKILYVPSSPVAPVTDAVVVYGCTDGAMRFHNLVPSKLLSNRGGTAGVDGNGGGGGAKSTTRGGGGRQATVKSVRGPNGRNDPVVAVINVDPAYRPHHRRGDLAAGGTGLLSEPTPDEGGDDGDVGTLVLRSRLLTACASGAAFLWEVVVAVDRASGALRDLSVLPPLARLDGLGTLTVSPRKTLAASPPAHAGGFWGRAEAAKSKDGSAEAPYSSVPPSISHDPHRHLLFWTLPPDAPASSVDHRGNFDLESPLPGSAAARRDSEDRAFLEQWTSGNGGLVKVWDLASADALIAVAGPPSSSPRPPPRVPPVAVARLPAEATVESPLGAIVGLPHAPTSMASVACACLSKDGSKLVVHAAPLPGAGDDTDEPVGASSSSPVKREGKKLAARKPKVLFANFVPCHAVSIGSGVLSPFVRGSAVSGSYLAPDDIVVATDQGVALVTLAAGRSWASKLELVGVPVSNGPGSLPKDEPSAEALPPNAPAGPIHSMISIGGVGNRPGIIFVENHAVHTCRLGALRSSGVKVEKVDLHDPATLCRLAGRTAPSRTERSTHTSRFVELTRPSECPPQLISSPSGRYLCLYWEGRRSYEILHAGSLLARERDNLGTGSVSDSHGQRVTPSVDSGNNVRSFAWVGDDDNFAIIRQHLESRTDGNGPDDDMAWGGTRTFSVPAHDKQAKSQVELFKLAEVIVDAVELAAGATVAAATSVSLGSLTVRGGDRVIPNALFGGPALCVSCASISNDSSIGSDEGIAYFYSRRSDVLEKNDERASAYSTIGTNIPYPDQVAWDEEGRLCAVSYGARVAIYLSENSRFILLGSIRLIPSVSGQPLVSMKFIHGALYCSSQTSVHVVFLGNTEDHNAVCELDTFTIATDCVPLYGLDDPDISSPVPVLAALKDPHILAYYSGGLLVSTRTGLRLLPLSHPIIRIGTLLGANLLDRSRKWALAFPKSEHDSLAHFLIRRGHVDMAISDLNGLSLKTYVDLCMRYDRTDELEHLIETHGSEIVPEIADWGRSAKGYSAYFAIGVYLLGRGRLDCAKNFITHATESGMRELVMDAMKLTTFLSVVDSPECNVLLDQVIEAIPQFALANVVK